MIEDKIAGPLGIPLDDALRQMEDAHAAAIAHALGDATTVTVTVLAAHSAGRPDDRLRAARRAGARHARSPARRRYSAPSASGSPTWASATSGSPAVDYATICDVADRLLTLGARDMFAEGVDASASTPGSG